MSPAIADWLRAILRDRLTLPAGWAAAARSLRGMRWVVVDAETSGLDPRVDRLISLGAVEVVAGKLSSSRGFEVILQQALASDSDNILVHRIDGSTQRAGLPAAAALEAFLQFAGTAPLVAFHADFDRMMIGRALRESLQLRLGNPWLDLAMLAPALLLGPGEPEPRGLDGWLSRAGIDHESRHNALADAAATAQLLQIVIARAGAAGLNTLGDLMRIEKSQRWLGRQRVPVA